MSKCINILQIDELKPHPIIFAKEIVVEILNTRTGRKKSSK